MIIFDDLSINKEDLLRIKAYISNLQNWISDENDPLIEKVEILGSGVPTYDISDQIVSWLKSFAQRNRLDVNNVVNIYAIKLNKKDNKEDIDYEQPKYFNNELLSVIFFLDDSDAHMFIFNEGEESKEEDLTVYTMFSPVSGRGFVLDTTKWHAYSLPSGIDAQYLIKVDFEGKIVSNQASTVYDLE
jgi:hypothetical protein